MCGIAGFIDPRGLRGGDEMIGVAREMAVSLTHRGPDDSGEWCDEQSGVAFGHRRLSIIDRSSQGHQPMTSQSGRYVITYNGEVYNFRQLAVEAAKDGARFRSSSDTEVLLATVERLGVAGALGTLVGMFAFALWDRQERVLYLARDRFGEKPLYFGWAGGGFVFASEIKALRCYPGWRGEVNRDALEDLLRQGYIRTPLSIYTDVYKLPPGTFLKLTSREAAAPGDFVPGPSRDTTGFHPIPYWSLCEVIEGTREHSDIDEQAACDELQQRLEDAVRGQMISDAPLGALLSGGVDSSLVVAVMQSQADAPVRTFTVGFSETDYNEAEHAKAVARHLGTDHTEMYVTAAEAREVIPRLPELYDEPFADSSQIPTYLVSQLAREHVTVALSGDAGDELFGGYTRYAISDRFWSRLKAIPLPLRRAIGNGLRRCPERVASSLVNLAGHAISDQIRLKGRTDQLQRVADLLAVGEFPGFYDSMVSHWKNPERVVRGSSAMHASNGCRRLPRGMESVYHQMMYVDTLTYLPDDILTKVDRAGMAVSLEVRVPLLDHRLVEWAWTLPLHLKVRKGRGKYLLRKVLSRYVPAELTDRPKMGFGVPIHDWLRGPLREWAEDLLAESRLEREGYFNPAPIRALWDAHLARKGDWHYYLWDVLMFQAWNAANT